MNCCRACDTAVVEGSGVSQQGVLAVQLLISPSSPILTAPVTAEPSYRARPSCRLGGAGHRLDIGSTHEVYGGRLAFSRFHCHMTEYIIPPSALVSAAMYESRARLPSTPEPQYVSVWTIRDDLLDCHRWLLTNASLEKKNISVEKMGR